MFVNKSGQKTVGTVRGSCSFIEESEDKQSPEVSSSEDYPLQIDAPNTKYCMQDGA